MSDKDEKEYVCQYCKGMVALSIDYGEGWDTPYICDDCLEELGNKK